MSVVAALWATLDTVSFLPSFLDVRASGSLLYCSGAGQKYELPNYVLSNPTNLQPSHRKHADMRPPQVELVGRAA